MQAERIGLFLCLVLLCIYFPLKGSAQGGVIEDLSDRITLSTRIGLNSVNEINLHGEYKLDKERSLAFSGAYNFGNRWKAVFEGFMCDNRSFTELFARQGSRLQIGFRYLNSGKEEGQRKFTIFNTVSLTSRYAEALNLGDNPHCRGRLTRGPAYDVSMFELGLINYVDVIRRDSGLNFYFAFGLGNRWRKETVSIPPAPNLNQPVRTRKLIYLLDIGCKFRLLRV